MSRPGEPDPLRYREWPLVKVFSNGIARRCMIDKWLLLEAAKKMNGGFTEGRRVRGEKKCLT